MHLKNIKLIPALILSLLLVNGIPAKAQEAIALAGEWQVQLDSLNRGVDEKWFNRLFSEAVRLPGTLDDAGLGKKNPLTPRMEKEVVLRLARKHSYTGAAWYNKEVIIPENWKDKHIELELERVIWKTTVWIDGKEMGTRESLSTPQRFDLSGSLKPGKHLISIRIDNSKQYEVSHRGMGHAYTDGTQIIWNGAIGKLQLTAKNKVRIGNIQTFPQVGDRSVTIRTVLQNDLQQEVKGSLEIRVAGEGKKVITAKTDVSIPVGRSEKELKISLGKDAELWDEFNSHLYQVKVQLNAGGTVPADNAVTAFGLREITGDNSLLQVNGRRIFLRGTLESAIFPLKGHPPMEKSGWLKVFETAKAYGLNHLRFHSWCPPKAAFEVADSLGFYLQVELPFWNENVGKDLPTLAFLKEETRRISEEYGNHPSFCLWSLGNELRGDFNLLKDLFQAMKETGSRHLYTTTTFTFEKNHGRQPEPDDQFFVTQYTTKGWVRGQGIFNTYPPDFSTDYTKAIDSLPVPIITHEIGQYSVYPNLEEIKKYTGVLDPLNFKAIRADLENKGLLDLAPVYTRASGKFSANLYKEEIERALKTKGMSGFQLLDLHDFPGQGTATVGILDAFWDSKGFVTAEEHRMYCSPVVPLIRLQKAVFTNADRLKATAEVANFGRSSLKQVAAAWTITNKRGEKVFSGEFGPTDIPLGNGLVLGELDIDLRKITSAEELTIEIGLKGTTYRNRWKVWVYPQVTQKQTPVVFSTSLKEALVHLEQGRNVLLNPDTVNIHGVQGRFAPVFWSPVHFPNQPGTMGILCDPAHPALRHFPTDEHSDWQWWDLVTSSKTMITDSLPALKPVVRVIDNFYKNRKMANIMEARVGKGKLILTSLDISHNLETRPAARQLRYSLEQYMQSNDFAPETELNKEMLEQLIKY